YKTFNGLTQSAQTLGSAVDLTFLGHEETLAMMGLQHAVAHQLGIGLDDGVGIHQVLLGQGTHAGHGITRSEGAGRNAEAHLLDDLAVDRRAGAGGDINAESGHTGICTSCYSTHYPGSLTLSRSRSGTPSRSQCSLLSSRTGKTGGRNWLT